MQSRNEVRFIVAGDVEYSDLRPDTFVQLSIENGQAILAWLWFKQEDYGYMEASELAARCRRRLWPIPRNFDPATPPKKDRRGNIFSPGRPAGFLRAHTEALLQLAERAGKEGKILFS
jgi:predicted Rdx family selenoprotein